MKLLKLRWLRILLVAFIIASVVVPTMPTFHVSIPSINVNLPEINIPWNVAQTWVDSGREWVNCRISNISRAIAGDYNFGLQPVYAANDRYWVGGSGSWNQTAHWSTSDGGAGGASVPNNTCDVHFTALSDSGGAPFTVTLSTTTDSCRNMDWSGIDVVANFVYTSSYVIRVFGSFTGSTNLTVNLYRLQFHAPGAVNIDWAGTHGSSSNTYFGQSTNGQYTFLSNMTPGGNVTIEAGDTVDLNNFNLTSVSALSSAGTFIFDGSVISCNSITFSGGSITATGSSIYVYNGGTFTQSIAGSPTFNDVYFVAGGILTGSDTNFHDIVVTGGSFSINMTAHGNNFTMTAPVTDRNCYLQLRYDQQFTGTTTLTGTTADLRLKVRSNTTVARTMTLAALVSQYTDYYYITAGGAADWDLSDAVEDAIGYPGCTGITFRYPYDPNQTLYWYVNGADWTEEYNWSTASGGYSHGGSRRHAVPTATNDVIFDANSFSTTGQTVTITSGSCHSMDWSAVTNNPFMNHWLNTTNVYGSFILAPPGSMIMSTDYRGTWNFCSTHTGNIINTAGHIIALHYGDGFSGVGGEWTLQSDLLLAGMYSGAYYSNGFELNNGSLILNGYNISVIYGTAGYRNFKISGSALRSINVGSSVITVYDNFDATTTTNLTYTDVAAVWNVYGNFLGGGLTYNGPVVITCDSSSQSMTGTNVFNGGLTVIGTAANNNVLALTNDITVNGNLTFTGNSQVNKLLICSSVAGVTRTIVYNNTTISIVHTILKDITGAGTFLWDLSSTNTSDAGGNFNIIFKPGVTYYWYADSGNWSNASMWFTGTGGTGSSGTIPLLQDIAKFDSNSFTMSTRNVNIDVPYIGNVIANEVLYSPTFSKSSSVGVYGNITLGVSSWNVPYTNFRGQNQILNTGTTIDSAGTTITGSIAVYCNGGTLMFDSNVNVTGSIVLYSGTLDFYNHNVVASTFVSTTATYARTLALGSGTFTLNSAGAVDKWDIVNTNLTLNNSTGTIILTNSSTNTQVFDTGGYTNYSNILVTGIGAYTLTFSGASFGMDTLIIDRSSAAKVVRGDSSTARVITLKNLVIPLAGTTLVGIGGGTNNRLNITKTGGGVITTDYLTLNYSTASPGTLTFYAGSHSTAASSPGWILSDYTLPMVSTTGTSYVNKVTAQLNGNIDWVGVEPTVYVSFEYGYTTAYGTTTIDQSFNTVSTFSQVITNLTPATTYHYRARLHYGAGSTWVYGEDMTFTTHAEPIGTPQILTIGVTGLSGAGATFIATLASMGYYSLVYVGFEYGLTTAYGATTAEVPFTGAGPVLQDVTNLVVGETYHYRAYARYNGVNYVYGLDKSFMSTLAILPIAVSLDPVNVTDTTATFQGSVDNMGNATQVWASFEYGLTASYGSATPEQTITTAQGISQAIAGLVTSTSYHYRLRVRYTATDYVYGTDIVFTTTGAGTPGTQSPDVLAIIDAKVISGYMTAGDQMYLISYKCIYLTGTPIAPASDYFVIQVLNNGAVVGQWSLPDWGYNPVGLYLGPTSALPYGGLYTIKIVGIDAKWPVSPIPSTTRTLSSGDWLGTDLTQFDNWVLQTAKSIGQHYNVELVTYTATGSVLNATGCALFNRNISGLSQVRPQLCSVYATRPTSPAGPRGTAYTDQWNAATNLGPYINGMLVDGATTMNMEQTAFNNLIGVIIWCIIVMILLFAFKGSFMAALLAAPCLMGISWAGLLIPTIIVVLAVINVALLAYALLPRGTG